MAGSRGVLHQLEHGWPTRRSNQTLVVLPTPMVARSVPAAALGKRTRLIEGHAFADHVVGGSCQLVRHRLDRYDLVGLGRLTLVEALDARVVAHGEVSRLDKRP